MGVIASWVWTSLLIGEWVTIIVVITMILRRPREPRAMLAWILTMLLLPVLGLCLFIVLGEPRKKRHRKRRRRRRNMLRASLAIRTRSFDPRLAAARTAVEPSLQQLMRFTRRLGAQPASLDNHITIYHEAEKTFLDIQLAIESAQSHVHLEYYIFQADETGQAIRDLLITKANQGVECRLLLDYIGCWGLSSRFLRPLRNAGVHVAFTMPVVPLRGRWRINYRNHRKIAVVDGRIGFTGSQNIGNEYSGRRSKYGPWRDSHLKVTGPAVQQLQRVFVEDWHYTTRQNLVAETYFPAPEPAGNHIIQIVPSGPDQHENVMHQLLFATVSTARSSLCMITPYFVPDRAIVLALQSAAYRGIRVQLIVPACSDHRVVLWAGRSYYEELARAGIEIYEHDHTMLHSKVMIVDEAWAMVGSANMDERSFRVNYELTTILYSQDLAQELYRDFGILRTGSRRPKTKATTDRPFAESMILGLARLASPLL